MQRPDVTAHPNLVAAIMVALVLIGAGLFLWKVHKDAVQRRAQPLMLSASMLDLGLPRAGDAGWTRIDSKDGFSFAAPPGTRLDRLQGKDAAEGEIVGTGFTLHYEFGLFSDTLEGAAGEQDYAEERSIIDGHVAILRRATLRSDVRVKDYATATDKSQRWFIGLYMPRVEYRPARGGEAAWKSLSIDGAAAAPATRAMVERLFKTIRFTAPPVRATDNMAPR